MEVPRVKREHKKLEMTIVIKLGFKIDPNLEYEVRADGLWARIDDFFHRKDPLHFVYLFLVRTF